MIPALVEGHLDGVMLQALWRQLGKASDRPLAIRVGGGSGFWSKAVGYNGAGRHQLLLGLADLEQAPCAMAALAQLGAPVSPGFKLRLAVRMVESWILADRAAVADFLGVPRATVPSEPDREAHPKRALVALARTSRKRMIRDTLVPQQSGAVVGPEYVTLVGQFIERDWSGKRASVNSPSLARAMERWAAL